MEERVSLLDGNLRIQSRLMEGTKIRIEIPLKEKTGA
jgi:signal transduction histidine kinase